MHTPPVPSRGHRPATPADLRRLAGQAQAKGVRLYSELVSGERFASSASRPGTVHRLTAYSCTCEGFCRWQRCMHLSALLSELGWIPPACGPCQGTGVEPDCKGHRVAGGVVFCEC